MKNKILLSLLVVLTIFTITGCGNNSEKNESKSNIKEQESVNKKNNNNDNSQKNVNASDNKISGDYVYMISENNMLTNNNPSKFGTLYNSPEDAINDFGHEIFVRHTIKDNLIKEIYIGFRIDNKIYYLKALDNSSYEDNKKIINNIFGKEKCLDNDSYYTCNNDKLLITLYDYGYVKVHDAQNSQSGYCYAKDNLAKCKK